MSASDCINVFVAIGTISLAVVATVSILQARKIQQRERRNRLLDEIIIYWNVNNLLLKLHKLAKC